MNGCLMIFKECTNVISKFINSFISDACLINVQPINALWYGY